MSLNAIKARNRRIQDSMDRVAKIHPSKLPSGILVWGRGETWHSYWPGILKKASEVGEKEETRGYRWIHWYDTEISSKVREKEIFEFMSHYHVKYDRTGRCSSYYTAVATAFTMCEEQNYFDRKTGKLAHNYLSNIRKK